MIDMPPSAVQLYAFAHALEKADPDVHDIAHLIAEGRSLIRAMQERGDTVEPGADTVWHLSAAATFMRAWAMHDDDPAILEGAAELERIRNAELALAAGPVQ